MPQFYYSARNEEGKRFAGTIEAKSRSDALSILSQQYSIVTRVEKKTPRFRLWLFTRKVRGEDLLGFAQTLSAMLEGGITVKRALDVIFSDTENRILRSVVMDLSTQIAKGVPLSDAMASHPEIFNEFFVKMTKAGEDSGELPEMLCRVAEYVERTEALKDKVKSALTYPLLVVLFALILVILVLTFGVPYLTQLYGELGRELPFATSLLIDLGNFLNQNKLIIALAGIFLSYLIKSWAVSSSGARAIDGLKLGLPLLGSFFRVLYTARFSRTLSLLYSSGIPLLNAVGLTGQSVGNRIVADSALKIQQAIERGDALSDCLRANPYYLDQAIGMVAAGEESGRLELMLKRIASFYEHRAYTALDSLTSIVEPIIMIGIGILVGFMIVALGMPFLNLATTL